MIRSERGAVTVYLCIIFLAMIIFVGVLIDVVRIRTAETEVKRAVESSATSVLAGYDRDLKSRFGLFALHDNRSDELKNTLVNYLQKNLGKEVNSLDLYDYRIEDVKVTPIYNYTENQVTRRQIVEFMKYRAPKQVIELFWGKISAMADTGNIVELSEKKMQIDKVYIDIVKDLNNLSSSSKETNTFRYNIFEKYIKSYAGAVKSLRKCMKKSEDIRNEYEKVKGEGSNSSGKDNISDSLKKRLSNALNDQRIAQKEKDAALSNVQGYLNKYHDSNTKAYSSCSRLRASLSDIKERITSLRNYIKNNINEKSSTYLRDLSKEITEGTNLENRKNCINEIERKLPNEQDLSQIYDKLGFNIVWLDVASNELQTFEQKYAASLNNGSPTEELEKYILPKIQNLKEYKNDLKVNTIYANFSGAKGTDPRGVAKSKAKGKLKQSKDTKNNLLKENLKQLPSYTKSGEFPNKIESPDLSKEDEDYKKTYESFNGINSNDQKSQGAFTANAGLSLGDIQGEINFSNNNFFNKAFDTVKDMGKSFSAIAAEGLTSCRDELYVDEYIIGMFSNAVPKLKNGISTENDLRGNKKQNTVNNEVEYILCGNTSDSLNLNIIKGEILMLRFAIDTVNIYRNPKKVEEAAVIAAAASTWSFGLSEPVIQNLVLCGWGMLDAVNDLDKVMEGEVVPAFSKYEKGSVPKNQIGFSYHDYLRIFLLLENSEQKMNRIEDLLQVKAGKKLSGYNTYIRVEADVSIKYLFLTQSLMPKELRTKDGARHKLKVIFYKGY